MPTTDNNRENLYLLDGITRVDIPVPTASALEDVPRGTNGDGSERIARKKKLVWSFDGPLTEAEYLTLTTNRPPNGRVKIRVNWPPDGATGALYIDCRAYMKRNVGGTRRRGLWYGLTAEFSEVEQS